MHKKALMHNPQIYIPIYSRRVVEISKYFKSLLGENKAMTIY